MIQRVLKKIYTISINLSLSKNYNFFTLDTYLTLLITQNNLLYEQQNKTNLNTLLFIKLICIPIIILDNIVNIVSIDSNCIFMLNIMFRQIVL